ncbi:Protein of unknown function DUF4406 [Comamonadaceae bacterium]
MLRKIYVAGPMTGLPDFNYPAFHAAAATLRDMGHTVLNPAENPTPPCGTWQGYMRMALAQCDCVVLLPGWADSRGALIERKLAQVLHMEVVSSVLDPVLTRAPKPYQELPAHTFDWIGV